MSPGCGCAPAGGLKCVLRSFLLTFSHFSSISHRRARNFSRLRREKPVPGERVGTTGDRVLKHSGHRMSGGRGGRGPTACCSAAGAGPCRSAAPRGWTCAGRSDHEHGMTRTARRPSGCDGGRAHLLLLACVPQEFLTACDPEVRLDISNNYTDGGRVVFNMWLSPWRRASSL